jgi:hypothetical protein
MKFGSEVVHRLYTGSGPGYAPYKVAQLIENARLFLVLPISTGHITTTKFFKR